MTPAQLPGENWKELPVGGGYYQVSDLGRVRSLDRTITCKRGTSRHYKGCILKQTISRWDNKTIGDQQVGLCCKLSYCGKKYQFIVHRMMYHVFIEPLSYAGNKQVILHKDGDNHNNALTNLVCATLSEKAKRTYALGRGHKVSGYITASQKQKGIRNRMKPVSQYSLRGEKLAQYGSISAASLATGICTSSIVAACKRIKMVSAGGFIWQYGNGSLTIDTSFYHRFIENSKRKLRKKITRFLPCGKRMATYKSLEEAGKKNGISPAAISDCLRGKTTVCGGFIWKYGHILKDIDVQSKKDKITAGMRSVPRKVYMICLQTKKVLRKFSSVSEAAQQVNSKSPGDISRAAANRNRICKGYLWRYAG